jgi:hypothetical protein
MEEYMFAVEGIFDGTAVQLDTAELPVRERCRVVVTFLNPAGQKKTVAEASAVSDDEKVLAESQAAYQRLLKYKGTLHRHIDWKKELAEYRDEKYGYSR